MRYECLVGPAGHRSYFCDFFSHGGDEALLAKRAVRIRSDQLFARDSDLALDLKMEEASEDLYNKPDEP